MNIVALLPYCLATIADVDEYVVAIATVLSSWGAIVTSVKLSKVHTVVAAAD
jgi:hypothetical protein